ncbi:MAG TPA: hypothetical protein VMM76_23905 [Pirellulaceae bacterium]|nr:hypothetical protein [Pirellulaceae bacterium]
MHSLVSVDFAGSMRGEGNYEIVTFAGFGHWSRDKANRPRLATEQILSDPGRPYVSIFIDGGRVSSVKGRIRETEFESSDSLLQLLLQVKNWMESTDCGRTLNWKVFPARMTGTLRRDLSIRRASACHIRHPRLGN